MYIVITLVKKYYTFKNNINYLTAIENYLINDYIKFTTVMKMRANHNCSGANEIFAKLVTR